MVIKWRSDASKFDINSSTGALTFKSTPDFENPTDSGKDNSYEVIVEAKDSSNDKSQQNVTVNVIDDGYDIALSKSSYSYNSSDLSCLYEGDQVFLSFQ